MDPLSHDRLQETAETIVALARLGQQAGANPHFMTAAVADFLDDLPPEALSPNLRRQLVALIEAAVDEPTVAVRLPQRSSCLR